MDCDGTLRDILCHGALTPTKKVGAVGEGESACIEVKRQQRNLRGGWQEQ